MEAPVIFESIQIPEPRDSIFRRLGYRRGVTAGTAGELKAIENDIAYAGSLIQLRAAALRVPIRRRDAAAVVCSDGIILNSRDVSTMLRNCDELLIMGATAGSAIVDAIGEDANKDRLTRGVILDAVASEMTDGALDWVVAYFNGHLRRENRRVSTRRFSAGYGDFGIENQKVIYDVLELSRIGVRLSDRYMLIPEKSVTAVTGIHKGAVDDERGETL
ncbi:MAG: hypothetical protein JXR85_10665 [Deltaproteobacteria bacterium]|nr:hypothetical protein [Deltaproteobacteria bacterium]